MRMFGKETEKAQAELNRLREARNRLESELQSDTDRVSSLRAGLGGAELAALLEGGDTAELRREIVDLDTKIAGRMGARLPLIAKLHEAIKDVAAARARAIRKEAARLKSEFDAHARKTGELLSALEQHAGIKFVMSFQPAVVPGAAFIPGELPRPVPKAAIMSAEIQRLLQEAVRIEDQARYACEGGRVTGSSLDELLAATADAAASPVRTVIERWVSEATARTEAEWSHRWSLTETRLIPQTAGLTYQLSWNSGGEIDQQQSTAAVRIANVIEMQAAAARQVTGPEPEAA
jgi:hypothetical protein